MKEVFILRDDDALVASGVLAKIGIGGFRMAGVKDVITIHALLAEMEPGRLAIGYRPRTSRSLNDDVIGLVCRVVNGGEDVLALQEGVIVQDFIEGGPGGQKLQHVGDANALSANAGTAPTLALFDCNSLEALQIHISVRNSSL